MIATSRVAAPGAPRLDEAGIQDEMRSLSTHEAMPCGVNLKLNLLRVMSCFGGHRVQVP